MVCESFITVALNFHLEIFSEMDYSPPCEILCSSPSHFHVVLKLYYFEISKILISLW